MPGHEGHAHAGEFLAHRAGLLGVAGIVADLDRKLLAIHTARRIDIGERHIGAVLELLPERGILAGHRPGHADRDGVLCERRARKRHAGGEHEAGKPQVFHASLPYMRRRTSRTCAILSGFPAMSSYFRGILARLAVGFRALAPRQGTGAFIKPRILPRHLARPGYPPGEAPDEDHVERIG